MNWKAALVVAGIFSAFAALLNANFDGGRNRNRAAWFLFALSCALMMTVAALS